MDENDKETISAGEKVMLPRDVFERELKSNDVEQNSEASSKMAMPDTEKVRFPGGGYRGWGAQRPL